MIQRAKSKQNKKINKIGNEKKIEKMHRASRFSVWWACRRAAEAGAAVDFMPSTSGISLGIANVASWRLRLTLLSLSNFMRSA